MNLEKHIWEGWTVKDFIEDLAPSVEIIMAGNSWQKPFENRIELSNWCKNNQSYYKKNIPDVVNFFAKKYNIH